MRFFQQQNANKQVDLKMLVLHNFLLEFFHCGKLNFLESV